MTYEEKEYQNWLELRSDFFACGGTEKDLPDVGKSFSLYKLMSGRR